MIAKLIAHGPTRADAVIRLQRLLAGTLVAGPKTNLAFLQRLAVSGPFQAGRCDTGSIERHLDDLVGTGSEPDPACVRRGVLALLAREQPARTGTGFPWEVADGFQLGAARRQPWPVLIDGHRIAIALHWPEPGTGGRPQIRYRQEFDPASEARADAIDVVPIERGVLVLRDGRQIRAEAPDLADAASARPEHGGSVDAPMHGRIVAVHVAPGDRVTRGQRLGIIEAMKMEHTLTAPADGEVVAVAVEPGMQVAEGVRLFTLTSEDVR